MACKTVFIVSEDPAVHDSLSRLVASAGLRAMALPSLEAWFETAGPAPCGCLVLDAAVGELAEPERLARFALACARLPVLVLVVRGDIPTAVHAMRLGAEYVLQKPPVGNDLLERIHSAFARHVNGRASC